MYDIIYNSSVSAANNQGGSSQRADCCYMLVNPNKASKNIVDINIKGQLIYKKHWGGLLPPQPPHKLQPWCQSECWLNVTDGVFTGLLIGYWLRQWFSTFFLSQHTKPDTKMGEAHHQYLRAELMNANKPSYVKSVQCLKNVSQECHFIAPGFITYQVSHLGPF